MTHVNKSKFEVIKIDLQTPEFVFHEDANIGVTRKICQKLVLLLFLLMNHFQHSYEQYIP